ncbi:uncharacterized protein METZ01_LOCUS52457 [marine metagenome]|uniref:Uncharacterized protein n=1 Tax=marine metagenome TaxID=408172 RepID=A0A381SEM0_9ZZZZ
MKHNLFIILIFFFVGCALDNPDENKLPRWSTILEVPIIQTTVDLNEFLEDSLITTYPLGEEGDSIFVFNKTIQLDTVTVGDKLKIDPIEKDIVQYASAIDIDSSQTRFAIEYDSVGLDDISELIDAEIGLINLDNIGSQNTDPISFSDAMPTSLVDIIEAAITASGGSAEVVVDTVALVPQQKSISFDSFTSATVDSGFIDVKIYNNLFIPLGAPIYVDIKNSIGTELFQLVWNSEIAAGDSSTISHNVSGMTLPGDMLVEVSGTSNGSQGEQVAVTIADLSSTFTINVLARDFNVSEASAIVPSQTIEDTSFITINPSETIVEQAIMSHGALDISVTNNLLLTGNILLKIPSLYYESIDSTLKLNFLLESGSFSLNTVDLDGWSLVMDFENQYLDYNYTITTDDTEPNNISISQTDNVELDLNISEIFFSSVSGQIESQIVEQSGDINIESESRIQSASISNGQMNLFVDNSIGGSANVHLTVPELIRGNSILDTVLFINSGENGFAISLSDYELQPVSVDDQRLTYNTNTITLVETNTYYLQDSINITMNLSDLTFDAVSGYLNQDDNIQMDRIDLDNDTKIQTAQIDSGKILFTIQNFIGLEADVIFSIEELKQGSDPLETSFQISSSPDPFQREIDLSGYTLSVPLDSQSVNYTSTLSIPSDQLLSLTLNDSIAIDVLIDTLWFGSITGIVDTVDVSIDTVKKEISALPEDMDGFDFANVEISIDFESGISIPVFLDLTLESSNSNGISETVSISNWNISDSSTVIVPNASVLINIQPDQILAYGSARVGGDGTVGSVTSDDIILGELSVRAPLEFEIGQDALITTDPTLLNENESEIVPEEIENIVLFVQYNNDFEFGSMITVLMSQDTLDFESGTADLLIDELQIGSTSTGLDSIELNDNRLGLFNQDSIYLRVEIKVIGQEDNNGNPVPSKFLSTDEMQLNIYGRVQYFIDGSNILDSE